jgi:hypothetical protein
MMLAGFGLQKWPKKYDLAVQRLVDLRDVAVRCGSEPDFARRLALLRTRYTAKPSLADRLSKNGCDAGWHCRTSPRNERLIPPDPQVQSAVDQTRLIP